METRLNSAGSQIAGTLTSGKKILSCTLVNGRGMTLEALSYGATITSLKIPTPDGLIDVVLGFDELQNYIDSFGLPAPPYFGTTVGRYAGRIDSGRFSIDGNQIQLNRNDGNNTLHGGTIGFSRKVWTIEKITDSPAPSVTFSLVSPDGDENFPGELSVSVTFTLSEENDLIIEYSAQTSKRTVINLTNHSYFNLDGHAGDIVSQQLFMDADHILEKRADMIPTGKLLPVSGHALDFRKMKECPDATDTTFVLNGSNDPSAQLFSPKTGIRMSVFTDQPAIHVYVGGNCFANIKGKSNASYHTHSGICFEAQNYPDAPNHPDFPNPYLNAGETYRQKTTYHFDVE